jgi:plasmid stability protein
VAGFNSVADVKVRSLDEGVVRALRLRAKAGGVSLAAEVRRSLADSIIATQEAFARRAVACRAATRRIRGRRSSDSAVLIRRERDAWG